MDELLLRNLSDEDLPLLKRWLYLPHVSRWYHDPLDWLEEVEKRKGEFSFLHHFIVEIGCHAVGFCQFYEYRYSGESWHGDTDIEGTYSIDYLIGDTGYLGKGYGKGIIRSLVERIRRQNNARRILVQPEPENKASCNALLSCGFTLDKTKSFYLLTL